MELNGPPFGEPTPPAHVEYSVQVPTQDDFDDIEKLTLLILEFTWSAQDDPIRKVILEEMKNIKSGKELVEEVRKIEKNINAGGTISSLLELSVAGISLDTCEVLVPSHSLEKDSIHQEEKRHESEDVLEAKAQHDPKLEFPSDQVEEPSSLTLEEVKEAVVLEDEELEIYLPIVIQECDVTCLSNPLDDMCPYDFFASTLHYKIPSLKVDLKNYLLGDDDTYPVIDIAHISDYHTYFSHARPMLNDKYHPHANIEIADSYHANHVLYCYGYIIGFEVTFLGTLVDSKYGEEEKQGAHRKKSDGGACTRKQRRRAAVEKGEKPPNSSIVDMRRSCCHCKSTKGPS
ncbi:hypothetical protein D1007_40555 [Hordeum vulgare]|nr:hypothetical protein D1007_40555 [Hordeum vulgare]